MSFYLVSQEWCVLQQLAYIKGPPSIFSSTSFFFLTHLTKQTHHCVSALSSHKLQIIKQLILMRRVQGRSTWLKHPFWDWGIFNVLSQWINIFSFTRDIPWIRATIIIIIIIMTNWIPYTRLFCPFKRMTCYRFKSNISKT